MYHDCGDTTPSYRRFVNNKVPIPLASRKRWLDRQACCLWCGEISSLLWCLGFTQSFNVVSSFKRTVLWFGYCKRVILKSVSFGRLDRLYIVHSLMSQDIWVKSLRSFQIGVHFKYLKNNKFNVYILNL